MMKCVMVMVGRCDGGKCVRAGAEKGHCTVTGSTTDDCVV